MKYKRSSNSTINHLSIESVRLLLAQPDIKTQKGRRDMVLLSLMYDIGARVQEIIDLTPESVNINRTSSIKVIGKGNKARLVSMLDAQTKHLTNYLKDNRLDIPHASRDYIYSEKNADMAREKDPELIPSRISPHSLRPFESDAFASGWSSADLYLGYFGACFGTEIYAHIETKQKKLRLSKELIPI